ncbi:MAG: DUF3842 family protein [Chloroflexi bacterium]|nr:DUF3842 family protein [Chloroflexota bacterium]
MGNARRWYIYITSAISLQAVTWAVISVARSLFTRGIRSGREFIAMQIAVIIIALPVFLVHWLWAQRSASENKSEKSAIIRRIYIYFILAVSLAPILGTTFNFFAHRGDLLNYLIGILVLAVVFVYHDRVLKEDVEANPPFGKNATVRRVYILSFSAAGLWMTTAAIINLLRLLFQSANQSTIAITSSRVITPEIVRLLLGGAIWFIFWRWAQLLFASSNEEEQNSVLRKYYLYLIVLITALSAVGAATMLLDGFFSRLLGMSSGSGGAGASDAFRVIFGMGIMWAYHAFVLRQDAASTADEAQTAGVRRLYLYIVAAIGLATFLIGLIGIINVLFDAIGSRTSFGEVLKDQLSWSMAAIIAGLPVWALPWRRIQFDASGEGLLAADNRRANARKNYLYFFLLAAMLTLLGNLINIVFQILLLILGERTGANFIGDLAESFSFAIIAGGVLAFHGSVLRADAGFEENQQAKRLAELKVAVLDGGEGRFGLALKRALADEFPDMNVTPVGLTKDAAQMMEVNFETKSLSDKLASADLIVGPWSIAVADEGVSGDLSAAVVASSARKLLIPLRKTGWDWAGVDIKTTETMVEQAVLAVKQILGNEEVKPSKPFGCASIALIVIGIFVLLALIAYALF